MSKIIAAINMTIDGYCDHTSGIPDDEIHHHYSELLRSAGIVLYGRITYELMKFWQPIVTKPTGNKSMDEFAMVIDSVPKIVFSHTLKDVEWETASLAKRDFQEVVLELKQQPGKDIFLGSRSLIVAAMNLNLIDEYQLCVHPVVAGKGLPLFENVNDRSVLKLIKTKIFGGGAVILYYVPTKE